jgi:uncharacterized membrane protein
VKPRTLGPRAYLKLYGVCLVAFLLVDFAWLVVMSPRFYEPRIGHLMADQVTWLAAIVFYLLFVVGVVVLVVAPGLSAGAPGSTLARAALLGVIAYATYDLTNLATLRDWPLSVTVVDIVWGAVLSVIVAFVGLTAGRRFVSR